MKIILVICLYLGTALPSFGQMILSAKGVNPENVCKPGNVYFLAEKRAKPLESIDSIELRINKAVQFAKENPTFAATASIQCAVNCNGELGGGFHVVTSTANQALDAALMEFFKSVKTWSPGYLKKKKVDSWYMWQLEIKDGQIHISN
ncbi:hypothetical protein [Sphingobacterium hungaricum]